MMHLGRTILSSVLALSLAACGGGGSSSGGGTGSSSGGTTSGGTGGTGCTLGERQSWVLSQLNEWYLFPTLLNTSVNPASYNDVQSYIDALVAPANAELKDRNFTYITSIREEDNLINTGSNAGFGIRLSYDTAASRLWVVEAFEYAPALAAGIDRGTEILSINGTPVTSLFASGGYQAVSDALGPSTPGLTRTLQFRPANDAIQTVTVTKANYDLDPISDRYGVRIFNNNGTKVGYVNLRTFMVQSATAQLRAAFQQFKDQGVTHVILDLRYNGGGLVSVARALGDLLGSNKTGQVFSRVLYRDSKAYENETMLFQTLAEAIPADRIAVIGREGTASASELVANAFIPHIGSGIGLIGTNTYGKPVGQVALDRSACDDRLRAVAFRTVNSAGGGDYYSGLASVMPATCQANDEFLAPLGDANEDSISVALDYLAGRSCTAIAGAGTVATAGSGADATSSTTQATGGSGATGTLRPRDRAEKGTHILLRSRTPSAAQHEIPGLF